MKRHLATALVTATLALPSTADAFTTRHGARVNPVNDAVFEVVPKSGSGTDIWCAAGDYAQRGLGAPWSARIYVVRGRGPSVTTNRKTAVHFTLNPSRVGVQPAQSFSLNGFKVGDSMSVQQAFGYCMGTMRFF